MIARGLGAFVAALCCAVAALLLYGLYRGLGPLGLVIAGVLGLFVSQRVEIERTQAIGPMYSQETIAAQTDARAAMTAAERGADRAEANALRRALRVARACCLALLVAAALLWAFG